MRDSFENKYNTLVTPTSAGRVPTPIMQQSRLYHECRQDCMYSILQLSLLQSTCCAVLRGKVSGC